MRTADEVIGHFRVNNGEVMGTLVRTTDEVITTGMTWLLWVRSSRDRNRWRSSVTAAIFLGEPTRVDNIDLDDCIRVWFKKKLAPDVFHINSLKSISTHNLFCDSVLHCL